MSKQQSLIPDEIITNKIFFFRNQKVMIDSDLAELYGVATKVLNQSVKRNIDRFPKDFMFQLTDQEFSDLKSQVVTSSWGGRRTLPYVFTEQGVAMLSSIINSETAIRVNIQIIRIFTRMRELLLTNKDILLKLEKLERTAMSHDEELKLIFKYLRELLNPPDEPRKKIGFKSGKEKE